MGDLHQLTVYDVAEKQQHMFVNGRWRQSNPRDGQTAPACTSTASTRDDARPLTGTVAPGRAAVQCSLPPRLILAPPHSMAPPCSCLALPCPVLVQTKHPTTWLVPQSGFVATPAPAPASTPAPAPAPSPVPSLQPRHRSRVLPARVCGRPPDSCAAPASPSHGAPYCNRRDVTGREHVEGNIGAQLPRGDKSYEPST